MRRRIRAAKLGTRGVTSVEYALIAVVMILATLALAPVGTWITVPLTAIAHALANPS